MNKDLIIAKQKELIEILKGNLCDFETPFNETYQSIEKLESELSALESEPAKGVYYCSVCHQNIVDAENGYDTCSDCVNKI